MSLTVPQRVVGWFGVNYSASEEMANGGKDLNFCMHGFCCIYFLALCFDPPGNSLVYVQTATYGVSWVICSADKTPQKGTEGDG